MACVPRLHHPIHPSINPSFRRLALGRELRYLTALGIAGWLVGYCKLISLWPLDRHSNKRGPEMRERRRGVAGLGSFNPGIIGPSSHPYIYPPRDWEGGKQRCKG